MASPPPGPARRSSTCPCRGRARTQGSKGASDLQHAHTHMRGDGDGGLGKDGGRMGAEGGGGRSCVPCAGIQVVQALGDAPASRATAAASSGVGVVHREKGVDPGASGLHRAAGCGSGAVVAVTDPWPSPRPHHPDPRDPRRPRLPGSALADAAARSHERTAALCRRGDR